MNKSEYQLNKVSKTYQVDGKSHVVLDDVSLTIPSQDITVILGASGCGKTTLLRIIARLEEFSSGEITFMKNGEQTKPKVGLIFQESRLMPWLNVIQNIGFHQQADQSELDRYLQIMKLEKFRNAYPNELSGGMAQRVSIARALSFEPDFLLMDEPFSALDYFTRMDMQNEVIRIHEETGKGVIFVTHDIDEALTIGTKVIVFTKNRILRQFEVSESEEDRAVLKRTILETLK